MIFREIHVEDRVLEGCEKNIGQVLPLGHSAFERPPAQHSRPEHSIAFFVEERQDKLGDDFGVVLVIGMDHNHDVAAELESFPVAGFLVGSVTPVFLVDEDSNPELSGEFHGAVVAGVVGEDDVPRVSGISFIPYSAVFLNEYLESGGSG